MTTRLIRCPNLIPSNLRTGPDATAAPLPTGSAGSWVDFGQHTEAGRLQENRDKRTLDQLYRRCDEENARINQPVRRHRFLGVF